MNVKTAAGDTPVKEQWARARAALSLTSLSIFSSENSSQADCMWEKSWRHFRRHSVRKFMGEFFSSKYPAMFHFQLKDFWKYILGKVLNCFYQIWSVA